MIAGLAVRPQLLHRRHDEREQRREQFLQQIADEEVLLPRFADDRRGEHRVTPVRERADREDRVVVLQRVVAVVIAEWTLGATHVRRTSPMSANSAFGDERMRPGSVRTSFSRSPAMSEASISSGTFSGSGAMAARMSAGGPPRNTVTGSA